jgi:hypothetical protein
VCSANDDPSTYTAPTPTKPRTYLLSGSVPPARVGASVALAVLGEMLSDAEDAWDKAHDRRTRELALQRIGILTAARDRITAAEAEYADGTVRG